jgi:hypothetical protein
MISYTSNRDGSRTVVCRCAQCQSKFDGLTQTSNASGEWGPDAHTVLASSGWLERSGAWFCGRFCADRNAYARAGRPEPMKAVTAPIVPHGPRPTRQAAVAAKR